MKKLLEFKKRVDPLLQDFFNRKIALYKDRFSECLPLIKQVEDLTMRGGERIRPALFCYGFIAIRKPTRTEREELFRMSIGLELFHSFALIHDDIMDKANLRRGKISVNAFFDQMYGLKEGNNIAILAGDLAFSFVHEAFHSERFPHSLAKAIRMLFTLEEETILGQYLDTILPSQKTIPTEEKIKEMIYLKTGSYTIVKPLLLGATLACAKKDQLSYLAKIGRQLGLAFQIRDDILGVFGKESETGKSANSDLSEKKRTLLFTKTRNYLTGNQKVKFLQIFYKTKKSSADYGMLRQMMKSSGSLGACEKEVDELVSNAKEAINKEKLTCEVQEFLLELANFIKERKT